MKIIEIHGLGLGCLTPLSTIFQLPLYFIVAVEIRDKKCKINIWNLVFGDYFIK